MGTDVIGGAGLPNPFVDCATLERAAEMAGFAFSAPTQVEGWGPPAISAIPGALIQLSFSNGEARLTLRKGAGTGDISGDYNPYPVRRTLEVEGRFVTLRMEDGLVMVAWWEDGGYALSLQCSGMAAEDAASLIAAMG